MKKITLGIISCALIFGMISASFPSNAAFQLNTIDVPVTNNTPTVGTGYISGVIKDTSGARIKDAKVSLFKENKLLPIKIVTTNNDGYYRLAAEEGKYGCLVAFKIGVGVALAKPVYVKGEIHIDLALTNFQGGLRNNSDAVLYVLVLDSNGNPVEGATVLLFGNHLPKLTTNNTGRAMAKDIDEGYYVAIAGKEGVGFGVVGPFFVLRKTVDGYNEITITLNGECTSGSTAYSTDSRTSLLTSLSYK